jgi:ABC-type Fe3+-siderophore transport system permease subunit
VTSSKKRTAKPKQQTPAPTAPSAVDSNESFLQQVRQNRFGYVGFLLSMLQLVAHAGWFGFVCWLSSSGQATELQPGAWQLWVVMSLIVLGAVLTMVSLFLCLYGAIHGKPKALALVGLSVSFFVGAFTTFALLIQATTTG